MDEIDSEAKWLFRQAVADVQPIGQPSAAPKQSQQSHIQKKQAKKKAFRRLKQKKHALDIDALDSWEADPDALDHSHAVDRQTALFFARAECDPQFLKRLRQGRFRIQASLDLHGMTASQATEALTRFLQEATYYGETQLLIVHGKGHNASDRAPVLKNLVNQFLPACPNVLAFCSARAAQGGLGSVYVKLRKPPT